jgi:23S rRNA (cytosine1962-C5)-methyltransferase
VAVADPHGRFLGQAFYSALSRIALRFVSDREVRADPDFWRERLQRAWAWRQKMVQNSNAYRLIFGEADGFPGLVVDNYAGHLVIQSLHPGMERLLPWLKEIFLETLDPLSITLRHDVEVRRLEGLPLEVQTVYGQVPERVEVREGPVRFLADLRRGQKTGLFLDQRDNRLAAAVWSRGEVLDAFAYQGGFGLHLASKAQRVTLVESSEAALSLAQANARLNGFDNLEFIRENVFDYLKKAGQQGRRFDLIVLDPPAFAKSRAERPGALRGYREINRRAFQLLREGGILITSSCSYNLSEEEFVEVVRRAAADAGRQARLVEKRGAAKDHPVLLSLPESSYLKCLILAVA